jgi:hypothetical protein
MSSRAEASSRGPIPASAWSTSISSGLAARFLLGWDHRVVGLYDMTDGSLHEVPSTSFQAQGVLERTHLQAALLDRISLLGPDLLVVAEEFGEFADANRRIDLLCVDRTARLVVVELKRTRDGGHLELQALRYAAMVSTMTFDDLVGVFRRHLKSKGDGPVDAEERLKAWIDDSDDGTDPVLHRDVRIILASAGFDKEITTTVLWLNDVFGLDIRCVRLTPYRLEDRLLLDVQPVIPLPEAAELTIQLRRREQAVKASSESGRDLTRFVVTTSAGPTDPLPKRRAVSAVVHAAHAAGVTATAISEVLPNAKFLSVSGVLDGDALMDAFVEQ